MKKQSGKNKLEINEEFIFDQDKYINRAGILRLIKKNMYSEIKSRVSSNGDCSTCFVLQERLETRRTLPPIHFFSFLNDLEKFLIRGNNFGMKSLMTCSNAF